MKTAKLAKSYRFDAWQQAKLPSISEKSVEA